MLSPRTSPCTQCPSASPDLLDVPIYVGITVDLVVRGTDGYDKSIITDATCTVNLFAPPKNPQVNPSVRSNPDFQVPATYDSVNRYYVATVSTSGWAPGTWWMQGVIQGGVKNYYAFDFFSFLVSP